MSEAEAPKPVEPVRWGRIIAAVAAGAVLAGLILVWVVPGMLDWNRYRDEIGAFASARLGRTVRIGGSVTLQLLPQPVLTANDVEVKDMGDRIGLQAKALRLRIALGPLLAGRIDARELTLQAADLHLPWPPPAGAFRHRPPAWISGLQARAEDSRLTIGDVVVTGVEATLATNPDTGTLSVAGSGAAGERRWQFTARLARPGQDNVAGLDVSLDGQGSLRGTGGALTGRILADGAVEGRIAGRGTDLSLLIPAPALPWRGDGRLNAGGGLAIADGLSLEIGGAPARGAVALRVSPQARLDLSIAAGRLDLDAWIPALLGQNPLGLRRGLPTGIDLSAEAATLAGGTLRQLRGAVDLDNGGIGLRDVAAVLPGDARVALSGTVGSGASAAFAGPVRLSAPDLRSTLRWLQPILPANLAALPPGVLRTVDLSGEIKASAADWAVMNLRGSLDGAQLSGAASVRLAAGKAPALERKAGNAAPAGVAVGTAGKAAPTKTQARTFVSADLLLDELALERWLPNPDALAAKAAEHALLPALLSFDSDLRLQATRAAWRGTALGALTAELQTEASRAFLRRLSLQPFGARLSASGQVTEAGQLADGLLELVAPELDAFQPLLARAPPALEALRPLLRGPGSAMASAAGRPDALKGRVSLELSDLHVVVQPTVNLPAASWAGAVTVHHPGAPRLLQTLGAPVTNAWLGDGSFSVVGQMAGDLEMILLRGATISAGSLRALCNLQLKGHRLTGQVAAETLPLPIVYPRSPEPLPLAWLRDWHAELRLDAARVLFGLTPAVQEASAKVTLDEGALRLGGIAGRLAGGRLGGTLRIDSAQEPPRFELSAEADGLRITSGVFGPPLDVAKGDASVRANLSAVGHSPAALLATLDGSARAELQSGLIAGFDLPGIDAAILAGSADEVAEQVSKALRGGETPFDRLEASAEFNRGVASVNGQFVSPAGAGELSGSWDLIGDAVDLRIPLKPKLGEGIVGPMLDIRVTGPAGQAVASPALIGLAQWLASRPIADRQ